MPLHRRLAAVLLTLGSAVVGAPAAAQDPTPEQLFEQGQTAMQRRDWATACPTLRRSYEASKGRAKGALYHLARCEDETRAGRLATALTLWRDVYPLFVDQADIQTEATERIRVLEGKVARLQLRRGAGSPRDLSAEIDGQAAAFDDRIAVDAGRHVVRAIAEGHAPADLPVDIGNGELRTLDLQPGARGAVAPTVVVVGPGPEDPGTRVEPPPDESSGSGWTTAGWISGGVGVAGLLVFAITAPMVASAESDLDAMCEADRTNCEAGAADAAERGETLLVPNTIGFVVGVAGVALGVTFLVVGSGDDGAQVAVRGDGVELRGRF